MRRGEATAEVVATGTRTYFGRAAELVRVAHVESNEQQAVLGIVRNLTIFKFCDRCRDGGLCARHRDERYHNPACPDRAIVGGAGCAAGPPSPWAATLGAKALALKGVLLTRLSALHEAAIIDVLSVDKTGTLTANELAVSTVRPVARVTARGMSLLSQRSPARPGGQNG